MPNSRITKIFAMKDAKVYKMLTDPAGAPTTYATGLDVPGMKSVAITRTYSSKTLRGDNQLLDTESILETIELQIAYAKFSFDVENTIFGGTITESGTTPNMKTVIKLLPTDPINFWKLEAQCVSADPVAGDFHLIAYKCKASGTVALGMAEEDYQLFGLNAQAAPTLGTPLSWVDEILNETAVAIVP
jgi:hypothetical protein